MVSPLLTSQAQALGCIKSSDSASRGDNLSYLLLTHTVPKAQSGSKLRAVAKCELRSIQNEEYALMGCVQSQS